MAEELCFKVETKYRLGKKLGKGKFGKVSVIEHRLTGWKRALK